MKSWSEITESNGTVTGTSNFLEEFFKDKHLQSWLSKFPVYNQNYLSILVSNKWSLIYDPNNLVQCLQY